jgi:acyl-coenzyme A thioesterase PaaI-like protein
MFSAVAGRPSEEHRVIASQNVSHMCLVCGVENPFGLNGRFYVLENGELAGVFAPLEAHQSYPGRLHGGVASAILDETIGRAIMIANPQVWGVTIEFRARFRRPLPLDREIRARARITRDTHRVFEGTGEIVLEDGSVAVEAFGRYLRQPLEKIAEGFDRSHWFADERERPETLEL